MCKRPAFTLFAQSRKWKRVATRPLSRDQGLTESHVAPEAERPRCLKRKS